MPSIRRPTVAAMRRAIKFYRDNFDDPKHRPRAERALLKLGREIDEDNARHNPGRKRA